MGLQSTYTVKHYGKVVATGLTALKAFEEVKALAESKSVPIALALEGWEVKMEETP